ncbi:MAG: glycosyltransferase family 1 protein [Chitinispirillaceae bacterium]|nr:glycosyltransferase family 1 protein [Chitinispirillaceae bacterium]
MKIVLAPEGTEGDIRPLLALGLGLRDAGHTVEACVPPDFIDSFTSYGIPSHPMSIPVKTFMTMHGGMMTGKTVRTFKPMLACFETVVDGQFTALEQHAGNVDLIIGAGLQFAGGSVAEKRGIAYRHVVHVPIIAPSVYYPPPITRRVVFPRFVNRALWAVYALSMSLLLSQPINSRRRKLGLPPVTGILRFFVRNMHLAMDPELATWPPDIHAPGLSQTAYWQFPDSRELDTHLQRFIMQGPRPVYIGFGSMIDPRPYRSMEIIRTAVKRLGIRAVVGQGWTGMQLQPADDNTLFPVCHTPHLKLFPHMAAVVHHGGAGTMHTAGLSGVPQVSIPHLLDQYYWGNRIHKCGLGPRPLNCARLTAGQLAEAIQQAIENPFYQENAKHLGAALRRRDGVAEAVKLIEQAG